MAAPRKLAVGLLRAVVRLAPRESREWASAMLHELDFVDGDWAALGRWAAPPQSYGTPQVWVWHG